MMIRMKVMVMVLPWVGSFFSWPVWVGSCKRCLFSYDEKCSIQNASESVRPWIGDCFVVAFGSRVDIGLGMYPVQDTVNWFWHQLCWMVFGENTGAGPASEVGAAANRSCWCNASKKSGSRDWERTGNCYLEYNLSVFLFRSNSRCSNISARLILFHVSFNPRKPCC